MRGKAPKPQDPIKSCPKCGVARLRGDHRPCALCALADSMLGPLSLNPGRELAAKRKTRGGGRPVSCECGACVVCIKRERMRKYRAAARDKKP